MRALAGSGSGGRDDGQVPGADHPGGGPGGRTGLHASAAPGVRSEPSCSRRTGPLREAPVRRRLQDHRHQPPGSSADPQRLQPQPRGDPEELRPFIQGERQVSGRLLLPAVQGGESQGAAGRGAAHPGQGREGERLESRDVTPVTRVPASLSLKL